MPIVRKRILAFVASVLALMTVLGGGTYLTTQLTSSSAQAEPAQAAGAPLVDQRKLASFYDGLYQQQLAAFYDGLYQQQLASFYDGLYQQQLAAFYDGLRQAELERFYAGLRQAELERFYAGLRQAELERFYAGVRQAELERFYAGVRQAEAATPRFSGDWRTLLAQYPWDQAVAARIVMCESGGDPNARNPRSSARGLFQILGGPLDASANVAKAYEMYAQRGWQPWDASRSCWR